MGKHLFGRKLKYEENFKTDLSVKLFIEFTTVVIEEELKWDIVYTDETSIEAKTMSKNSFVRADPNYLGEKIIITMNESGTINVMSRSMNVPGMWDMGRNHKWVTEYIIHFKNFLNKLTDDQIVALKKSIKEKKRDDVYIVPSILTQPITTRAPSSLLPIVGGAVIAIIVAGLLAYISSIMFVYILWGMIFGIVFAFTFAKFIQSGKYTEIKNLKIIGATSILLLYFFNQYFQYLIVINEHNLIELGFMEFIRLRLEHGFTLQRGDLRINYGSIGLILSWIFQIGFTYFIFLYRLTTAVMVSQVGKIPPDVIDFILNYLNEGKSEDYIRIELTKRGWKKKEDQNLAFKAVDATITAQQIIRQG